MTQAQIDELLAANGGVGNLKAINMASGRLFSVSATPGVAGRYSVTFSDANLWVALQQTTASETNGNTEGAAVEYVSYDDIEGLSFF